MSGPLQAGTHIHDVDKRHSVPESAASNRGKTAPYSITSAARAISRGWIEIASLPGMLFIARPATGSNLPAQPNTRPTHMLRQSIPARMQFSPALAHVGKIYVLAVFLSEDDHHP
jgi:hypothetical protein